MNNDEIYFKVKQLAKDKKLFSKEADEFFRSIEGDMLMEERRLRANDVTNEAINHARSEEYKH